MPRIATFTFSGFQENTYVVHSNDKRCYIIDPGCYTGHERNVLRQYIESSHLLPVAILNTHCHLDHIFGNAFAAATWQLPVWAHRGEVPVLEAAPRVAEAYGVPMQVSPPISRFVEAGEVLSLGDLMLQVLFVPGHAPGHVAFYNAAEGYVVGGDVLFQRSIGRTDLPGGDYDTLMRSILDQMLALPDDTVVYSGHGPATTIGEERRQNPFILEYVG